MQKHFIILIIYIVCSGGCAKGWNNEEKNDFRNDCIAMNGAELICVCVLACLEKEYITYNAALNNIEEKGLSKECRVCLEQCE